jgi:hypothetical protein
MRMHALSSLGLRFSRVFLFVGLILISFASARATASEIIVKTDSLPPEAGRSYGLSANWRLATLLTAPSDGTIVGVQILWGSAGGAAAPSQQTAIRISSFDGDQFAPAATLATIELPTLADGVVNEFRFLDPGTNFIPLAVPISSGESFFVDIEFASYTGDGNSGLPSVLLDSDGTQGTNSLLAGGLWLPYSIGVTGGGDIGIRAIIQPVPEPSTYVLAAMGVVAMLALGRKKLPA